METIKYQLPGRKSTQALERDVSTWQAHYHAVISVLGKLGTEVSVQREFVLDAENPPYFFVQDATHDFVFPPQEIKFVNKHEDGRLSNNAIQREDKVGLFDASLVEGHLHVEYGDSSGSVKFRIIDLMDPSRLPNELGLYLDQLRLAATRS